MFKVGVIGLGSHFIEHILIALKLNADLEISVICDIDDAKIVNAKSYLPNARSTKVWQDVYTMGVDIVMCISFPQLHEGIILHGIQHGIPVFVEKPPYLTSGAINDAIKLKRDNSYALPIGVGINFNFSSMAGIIQNIISSGVHGRVIELDICHLSNKPNEDIWGINNPLQTMLLAQAIHPLAFLKMFADNLNIDAMTHILTEKNERYILKLAIPILNNSDVISATIRTGNFGPRFKFHTSCIFEDGTRLECEPDRVIEYSANQAEYAGSTKWAQIWEAKPFLSGIEKGGYAQEITAFMSAVKQKDHGHMYDPSYFLQIYQIMEKVLTR